MKKHYVIFYSPGTLVAETTTKEIEKWDIVKAVKMAEAIEERYGAKPYGFQFSTKKRGFRDFDSKETKRSSMYYLGGKIYTLEELKAQNDPDNRILISNMERNGYARVVINNNSYEWTQPLDEGDMVLDLKEVL